MGIDNESVYSNEEDSAMVTMQAQQRILQLKKNRDDRMNAVVADAKAAMENLRSRVVAFQEEREQKKFEEMAALVLQLIEAMEKKRDIENKMEELVTNISVSMKDVEEMMKIGFLGRMRDLK